MSRVAQVRTVQPLVSRPDRTGGYRLQPRQSTQSYATTLIDREPVWNKLRVLVCFLIGGELGFSEVQWTIAKLLLDPQDYKNLDDALAEAGDMIGEAVRKAEAYRGRG